jgi:hypothetical protein
MDAKQIFKIWLCSVIAILIASGLCLIIGIIKNNQLLMGMPILGIAIASFSTYIRNLIIEENE